MLPLQLLLVSLQISLVVWKFVQLDIVALHEPCYFSEQQTMRASRYKNKHDEWVLILPIFEYNEGVSSADSKNESLEDGFLFSEAYSCQ